MSARARRINVRSVSPRCADGVPTQMSEISAASTASLHDEVARSAPFATAPATKSVETRLGYRATARADVADLAWIDVDSPDLMSVRS